MLGLARECSALVHGSARKCTGVLGVGARGCSGVLVRARDCSGVLGSAPDGGFGVLAGDLLASSCLCCSVTHADDVYLLCSWQHTTPQVDHAHVIMCCVHSLWDAKVQARCVVMRGRCLDHSSLLWFFTNTACGSI